MPLIDHVSTKQQTDVGTIIARRSFTIRVVDMGARLEVRFVQQRIGTADSAGNEGTLKLNVKNDSLKKINAEREG